MHSADMHLAANVGSLEGWSTIPGTAIIGNDAACELSRISGVPILFDRLSTSTDLVTAEDEVTGWNCAAKLDLCLEHLFAAVLGEERILFLELRNHSLELLHG